VSRAEVPLPPRAPLVLFALWLMVFSSGSQVVLISPLFPRIQEQLGVGDAALGTLITVDAIMLGLVALISGPISDRVGRRRILLAGTGLMSIALALHAFAFDYASLMVVRGLAGGAGGVLSGSAVAYVGDYFPYQRRGWANGWVMTGMAFGHIVGIPAGTMLAAAFGFRVPYLGFGLCMAATFVLVWRVVPQPAITRSRDRLTIGTALRGYGQMLRTPAILAAVITFAVTFLGNSLFVIYLPTWLEHSLGATPSQVAVLFFAGGVANVLSGPRAGRLSDRIGRKVVIIGASIGLALLILSFTLLVTRVTVAYVLFFFAMILFAARIGPFQALLTQLVPAARRGALMSLTVGIGQVGFAVGGSLAGFTYARHGYFSNTLLSCIFLLATAMIIWRALPEPEVDTVPASGAAVVEGEAMTA
jgi:predicted MFS family arabinose efflux permease